MSERLDIGVDLVGHAVLFPDGIDLRSATDAADRAGRALGDRDADPSACELHVVRSMVASLRGRTEEGREGAEHAYRLAVRLSDARAIGLADVVGAWHRLADGEVSDALSRIDAAWLTADEAEDEVVAPLAARTAGWMHMAVFDLPGARVQLMREIGKRRASPSSMERKLLGDALATVGAMSGRIGEAVRLSDTASLDDGASTARPIVAACQGHFDEAEELWRQVHERARTAGCVAPWISDLQLARLLRFTDRAEEARDLLSATLGSVYGAGILPAELAVRADVALVSTILDDTEGAEQQLQRCDEILAMGDHWCGVTARVELARAALHGASGVTGAAVRAFERAADAFNRYSMPWDEAEAHVLWGRMLLDNGRGDGRSELDAAVMIYDECRAGRAWADTVRALA